MTGICIWVLKQLTKIGIIDKLVSALDKMAEHKNSEHIKQLLNTLGKAYLDKGDYPAAIEKLEKALDLGSRYSAGSTPVTSKLSGSSDGRKQRAVNAKVAGPNPARTDSGAISISAEPVS